MSRKRIRWVLVLFCFLFCLFSTGGGSFDGTQEATASPIRGCMNAVNADMVRTGRIRGSINPLTGLCGGIEMVDCDDGWRF
jgi:hypothetical protein